MDLDAQIEAYLFYKGEPEEVSVLARFFEVDEQTIHSTLVALAERLKGGVVLVVHDRKAALVTSSSTATTIEKLRKAEVTRDLGKAGLETLAIIIYKGPVQRSEVDYIRGVNSSYIIRNLLIRGLIERRTGSKGTSLYVPSIELLAHMGIESIADMPEYVTVREQLVKKVEVEPVP